MKKFFALLMVVAMMFAIAVPVAAEISPDGDVEYDVETEVVPEGGGNITETENEDGSITIVIDPDDGNKFIKWEIEGDFEWIAGDENSTTITIMPKGDIKVKAQLEGKTVTPTPKPTPGTQSPSTGVVPAFFAVAMVVSMAGAGYSFKKSSK